MSLLNISNKIEHIYANLFFLFIGESISSTYKCNISFLLIGL